MSTLVAALPMYDWAELRSETDAAWTVLRGRLRAAGYDAPDRLARRNADLPAVPGGIRDAAGRIVAPDPATLDPEALDLRTLWRHPDLLFAQTCWGPMQEGLADGVAVLGQPDYSRFEGGRGSCYSSAILMRRGDAEDVIGDSGSAKDGGSRPTLPLLALRGKRLAFNGPDSMSGIIALNRDLESMGESLDLFSEMSETGAHRVSIVAVAKGQADVCAVDCRTWDLARRFEPSATDLTPVGWTAMRKGLPYIAARRFAGQQALVDAVERWSAEQA